MEERPRERRQLRPDASAGDRGEPSETGSGTRNGEAEASAQPSGETQRLAVALAATSGYVNAVGYLALYRLAVGHQTGNSIDVGIALSGGHWTTLWRRGVPILAFVAGVVLGTVLVLWSQKRQYRSSAFLVAVAEVAAFAVAYGVGEAMAPSSGVLTPSDAVAYAAVVTALALAMGLQTTALHQVNGKTIRTTFITDMLTNMAETFAIALYSRPRRATRQRRLLSWSSLTGSVWLAFTVGAVTGAAVERELSFNSLAVAMVILAAVAAYERRTYYRPSLVDVRPPEKQAIGYKQSD